MKSRIYIGKVMHARFAPVEHRFAYPVYVYALDLDELRDLDRQIPGFGYNRRAAVSIRDRDYLRGSGSIRERLMRFLADRGIADSVRRVELVTMARFLNYAFNPVSFYYCYDADDALRCNVAEVNNTFGERHLYILDTPVRKGDPYPVEYVQPKAFHVSPFNDRRGEYRLSFSELGESMRIAVTLYRDGSRILVASIWGTSVPLTGRHLAGTLCRYPVTAFLTFPRISWEAARLFFRKRLKVVPKPPPCSPMTIGVAPLSRSARVFMWLVLRMLSRARRGQLTVYLPDGRAERFGGGGEGMVCSLTVREAAFFRRVVLGGDIGFGESYVKGEWETADLVAVLEFFVDNLAFLQDEVRRLGWLTGGVNRIRHWARRNTRAGSRRNIRDHYDVGNAFYRAFLDPGTMLYSCGIFDHEGVTLGAAQEAKVMRILELAQIGENDHVLEIGCGWGGFAIEAARRTGCRITGITVSREQEALARERVREAGLEERVKILFCDYRDMEGTFDRIVSIEMLEAVGHDYLETFFRLSDDHLKDGGRMVVQVITIPDERYDAYRRRPDWIQKYIFPGGMLPCPETLKRAAASGSSLRAVDVERIGPHYAKTLHHWRERFRAAHDELLRLGYGEPFLRRWDYYFAYCEAGFAREYIDDLQIVFARRTGSDMQRHDSPRSASDGAPGSR